VFLIVITGFLLLYNFIILKLLSNILGGAIWTKVLDGILFKRIQVMKML
jgi:hypothetical protein